MNQPPQRLQGSKDVPDVERQTNIALERLNQQIIEASKTGGISAEAAAGLQSQITELQVLSGAFPAQGGTGTSAPTNSTSQTSSFSSGNPVPLDSGGTGISQSFLQQFITNGTLIAPGTAQAQPALSILGVAITSAVAYSIAGSLPATWQTGIFLLFVCSANTVTPYLVNPTASNITPAAQAVNVKVIL